MSKMGAYVLEIQTKSDEEYGYGSPESLRSGRHRDKLSVGYDMVRGSLPPSIRHGSAMHHSGAATCDAEQSGCDSGSQFDWVRFGEAP